MENNANELYNGLLVYINIRMRGEAMEKIRVKVNGTELEVIQYPNKGESIIFLHFSGGNMAQWNGVVPYFIDKYNVVTLDLRGHGKSEKSLNGYTLDNMALDIIEVMNELKIMKAHIVGSSLGGEIAVSLAANYPEKIQSVVAEGAIQSFFGKNGVMDIPEEEIHNKKAELRSKRALKKNLEFSSIYEKIEAAKLKYIQADILWNLRFEEFELYDSIQIDDGKYTSCCPKWVIDEYLEDYWDIKFENYFNNIKCPVLMLPSEDEWEINEVKESIKNFQKQLNTSQVQVVNGGSHAYVALQYPLEFSNAIKNFYDNIK